MLNISNPRHVLLLQYIFYPRLQRDSDEFVSDWNNHGIRTEHSCSTRQIFIEGAATVDIRGITLGCMPLDPTLDSDQNVDDFCGAKVPDGPLDTDEQNAIVLDELYPNYPNEVETLENHVNPL